MVEAVLAIAALITAVLAWLQYRSNRPKREDPSVLIPHHRIRIYLNKQRLNSELVALINRAEPQDVLFGMCRTCAFGDEIYSALARAVARQVSIDVVVWTCYEAQVFSKFILGLNQRYVRIRTNPEDHVRMIGIARKEVIIAQSLTDRYLALHFTETIMVNDLYLLYERCTAQSKALP